MSARWQPRARLLLPQVALAAAALGSVAIVLLRLLERWRLEPAARAPHVTVLGLTLSRPSANLAALLLLGQALLALGIVGRGIHAAVGEVRADRRLRRELRRLDVGGSPAVRLLADRRQRAFCAGLFRPRVYLSTGAAATLEPEQLAALLAHELEHRRRFDPLRLAGLRVLATALAFLPGIRGHVEQRSLAAELAADARGIVQAGSRAAYASLLLAFDGDASGIEPARAHALLGRPPARRFPLAACLGALGLSAAGLLVVLLAGRAAAGSATLALPLLSSRPCVLVLALAPALLGVIAWRGVHRKPA